MSFQGKVPKHATGWNKWKKRYVSYPSFYFQWILHVGKYVSWTSRTGMLKVLRGSSSWTQIKMLGPVLFYHKYPICGECAIWYYLHFFHGATKHLFQLQSFALFSDSDFLRAVYLLSSIYWKIECPQNFDAFIPLSAFGSNSPPNLFISVK